ncbi:MAG: helix-turn-helix domain-containing protein [Paenibacillus macerans]|uniref:Helix-turn-helix domain protein n=1 Tax=Paenibacillus macerans TaxID=44252 RepID=A0A090ZVM4_PAEMA|nr:helix-turn-helix domain-containing protein [Paenibacillus macerans]KFN08166.1 helix-turn-helix domain protein [Paenibacillus macerans]MBS5914003.1 helix-turn-helix domain-containing protein [Paenibacillus macerans]MCY7557582.1 helix-turn-helix domain-containing protein [Paenibacillus macerans]MDU7474747.1 helix-turn-helix domain-containing protein [Paenibacillus macerans]MEC0152266.1 helix-turn-helix domain-containing protein [Paenibacillus macerans]
MDTFVYKKAAGITALSASMSEFEYVKHSHEEYAFGVTLRGVQQYNLDGSFQSSYRDGVMLFHSEQVHDGRSQDRTGIDYVMVYIHPKLFMELAGLKEIVKFSSPIVYNRRLKQSILNLVRAIFGNQDEALCYELLAALADHFSEIEMSTMFGKGDSLIIRAKEMIYANLDQVLKLDELCGELGMTKFQFIRAFKANTGISPYRFFLNSKLEHAKRMIEKNKDIYAAVAACGFVDLSHLNKHFKRVYGITAREYISNIR